MSDQAAALRKSADQLEAAAEFIETWEELFVSLHSDYSCTMTCTEADAAVALLEAFGKTDAAQSLAEAHASTDEPGDAHYTGTEV